MKAIGLFSGGLDSSLAIKMVQDLGFEVLAVNFKTPFCLCDSFGGCYSQKLAEKLNIPLKKIFLNEDYINLIKNPKFGYGRNMNPCLDCRVFMLTQAKKIMEEMGASFVFTGEVLGERPMSQRLDALRLIEKHTGLEGKILRPLSARLLEPTLMEKQGLVDREKLLAIQGRSRKPQMALAESWGISDYPCPAGGCLLTDENFAKRLKDSFVHQEDSLRHITLLKIGRHFRTPSKAKIIAGRNKEENEKLLGLASPEEMKLTVVGHKSTYVLLLKKSDSNLTYPSGNGEADKILAARICARYSKERNLPSLIVKAWFSSENEYQQLEVSPIEDLVLCQYRI